jgi:hypothetical protein
VFAKDAQRKSAQNAHTVRVADLALVQAHVLRRPERSQVKKRLRVQVILNLRKEAALAHIKDVNRRVASTIS